MSAGNSVCVVCGTESGPFTYCACGLRHQVYDILSKAFGKPDESWKEDGVTCYRWVVGAWRISVGTGDDGWALVAFFPAKTTAYIEPLPVDLS